MTVLDDLLRGLVGKTQIQIDQELKELVGTQVEKRGFIADIYPNHLLLQVPLPEPISIYASVTIHFHGEHLERELLSYSRDDEVDLRLRLTGVWVGGTNNYIFELESIVRVSTRQERQRRAAEQSERLRSQQKQDNCFIATAAYGLQSHHVVLLRMYRDRVLSQTCAGRTLIRLYYAASPPLARFINGSERRRSISRLLLKPIVSVAKRRLGHEGTYLRGRV